MENGTAAYTGWAIVELMGHRVIAGQVQEVSQFGCSMLRVDVPGTDGIVASQFYGGNAIYCLTPCDETAARGVLERRYSLPEPVRLALQDQSEGARDRENLDLWVGEDEDDY
ncbi:MAG: hypothetical protein ACPGO3_00325 [Magnetospiraceae bacterium]